MDFPSDPHLVSLNVGLPRHIETRNGVVVTSIFKSPVTGRRGVHRYNIDGDRQSDLTVHGGPHKAIYAYADEHYSYWARELPKIELTPGHFGENLTTTGLNEEDTCIGDEFRVGSTVLNVTQPRMPCFKLALRFGLPDMVKRFWLSGRSGIYFGIVEEGELGAGDRLERISRHPLKVSVADVVRLFKGETTDRELADRALAAPIGGSWKEGILERRES